MGLRLVDFDPNDYKLGEVLSLKHGQEIEKTETISKVLSLYFQWPSQSKAFTFLGKDTIDKVEAALTYDNEERELTQIFISVPSSHSENLKRLSHLFLRVNVFDNCFEMECEILEVFAEAQSIVAIVQPPIKISSIKARQLPRVAIDQSTNYAQITFDEGTEHYSIIDVSLNAFSINGTLPANTIVPLLLDSKKYTGKVIHSFNKKTVISIIFNNDKEIGMFFDYYKQFAFPSLRGRQEIPYESALKLYKETGYTNKFEVKGANSDTGSALTEFWNQIADSKHELNIDYYITNEDAPTGASSCTLAFQDGEQEVWSFHQLCALKVPELVRLSGDLYAWRAEYLAARKNNIKASVWYSGKSRWLERIYVKFHMQNANRCTLTSVKFIARDVQPRSTVVIEQKISVRLFGNHKRYYFSDENILAAGAPDHLNANRNLNVIIWRGSSKPNIEYMSSIAEAIAYLSSRPMFFRFCYDSTHGDLVEGDNIEELRYSTMSQECLIDFANSLNHSMAITERKLSQTDETKD